MLAHPQREPHFTKIPDADGSVLACRGHPSACGIKRNGIYACQLQGKFAVGMAERRTRIVVRAARNRKGPRWTRGRNTAGEAQQDERGPAKKSDEFLPPMLEHRMLPGVCCQRKAASVRKSWHRKSQLANAHP